MAQRSLKEKSMKFYRAKVDQKRNCYHCGSQIKAGVIWGKYRDRAKSNWEACHAGGLYLDRILCQNCFSEQDKKQLAKIYKGD